MCNLDLTRVLDLCSGSGIQGLFYGLCNEACMEMTLVDIDEISQIFSNACVGLNTFILKNQVIARDSQESWSINEIGIVISDLYSCFENDSFLSTILVYPTFIALPWDGRKYLHF